MGLINNILYSAWAIEPRAAESYLPEVARLLRGEQVSFAERRKKIKAYIDDIDDEDDDDEIDDYGCVSYEPVAKTDPYQIDQSYAIVTIDAPIMKEDGWCSPGTETLGKIITKLSQDASIRGIMLKIDSPGGMVDGTETFVNTIKEAQKLKPIISFVSAGLACSAAYWIASEGNEIIASEHSCTIGSIGVMISFMDYSEYWKINGFNKIEVYAAQSKDKNKDINEAIKGNPKPLQESTLNVIAENFIAKVKANRPKVAEEVFTGKTYLSEMALELGLIDSIGDYTYAISRLEKLASKKSEIPTLSNFYNSKSNMSFITSGFNLIRKALGFNAIAQAQDGSAIIATSDLANIEAELSAKNEKIQDLENEKKATKEQLEQSQVALKTANAEIDSLKASLKAANEERDSLTAKFLAQTTPVQKGEDAATKGNADEKLVNGFYNPKAEHNQEFIAMKGGLN